MDNKVRLAIWSTDISPSDAESLVGALQTAIAIAKRDTVTQKT
jgi:hypothetical protein